MSSAKRKEKELAVAGNAPAVSEASSGAAWTRPAALSPKGLAVVALVVLGINLPLIHYAFLRPRPEATLSIPYRDDFSDPKTVQQNYTATGGYWRVVNGELFSPGVKNNPLWLKAKLPAEVSVEFDVRSESNDGDIKVEIFGDGSDHASGYVLIHGGWMNALSIIARLDEHGEPMSTLKSRMAASTRTQGVAVTNETLVSSGFFKKDTHVRVEANPFRVVPNKMEHWRIERRGSVLRWFIDGQPFMEFDDPIPLTGPDHDRFGFSSYDSPLYFDNLKIE